MNRILVPASFAAALLDDWRVPPCDDERESTADPEQIAYEEEIDGCVGAWLRELAGPGDRALTIPHDGPGTQWLREELAGSVLEGLTERLSDGTYEQRTAVVQALAGWVDVMSRLEQVA
jgi:hypothetical protein